MPIYINNEQLNTFKYFELYFSDNKTDNFIPEDIPELESLISTKKTTLEFINFIYDECFNATSNSYQYHISKTISNYINCNDEQFIYDKSKYYVFDMDRYFIRTKEGNYRNWIYAFEIDKAYNDLQDEIINLQLILEKKQILLTKTMLC
jgi:hypothetical protein